MTTNNNRSPEEIDYIQQLGGLKIAEIRTRKKSETTQRKDSVMTEIEMISAVVSLIEDDAEMDPFVLGSFLARLNPKEKNFNIIQEAIDYGDESIIKAAVMVTDSAGRDGIERARLNDPKLHNEILNTKLFPESSATKPDEEYTEGHVKRMITRLNNMGSHNKGR